MKETKKTKWRSERKKRGSEREPVAFKVDAETITQNVGIVP